MVKGSVKGYGKRREKDARDGDDEEREGSSSEMAEELKCGKEKVRGKSDAVEHSDDQEKGKRGAGQEAGAVLVSHDSCDEDKTPEYEEGFNGIRKRVSLIRPGHVRRRRQYHGRRSLTRRIDQLLHSPVLQNKTEREHQDAQRPIYEVRR